MKKRWIQMGTVAVLILLLTACSKQKGDTSLNENDMTPTEIEEEEEI